MVPLTTNREPRLGAQAASTTPRRDRTLRLARVALARYGLLVAFAAAVAAFSIARPDTFPTVDNFKTILAQAAPPLILSAALTVVLAMQDFDLSFGAMIGLANGIVVILIVRHGVPWPLAILACLAAAVLVGLLNGFLIAGLGGSSFIITLAVGTGLTGLEYAVTNQEQIFQGLPSGFVSLGQQASFLGLNNQVWVAAFICACAWVLLERTEPGRYIYAIGSNAEAARLAGLPTRGLRVFGFIVVAAAAAVVGVLLAALTSSYTPNIGPAYLLPGYAAVFLGAAAFRPGQFNIAGSVVGVVFLGVIQTGLTMLNLQTYVINLVQSAILVTAVLLSRLGQRLT